MCPHRGELEIKGLGRGPVAILVCSDCGARWEVSTPILVLLQHILDRQEVLQGMILDLH